MTANDIRTPQRRSRRGLVIDGTASDVSPEPVRRQAAAARQASSSSLLDLTARLSSRPYQSLLDDAMRLAKNCRPLAADPRTLSPSS